MRIFGNRVIAIKSEPCLFKSAIRNSQSAISSGVWCNASIRVLGTRGDSSILSSPTKKNCGFRIANCGLIGMSQPTRSGCPLSNPQSEFRNPQSFCSCSSNERARRFERRGCGFKSCQEFQFGVRRQASARRRFGSILRHSSLQSSP